jgi:hypothetical protein
MALNWITPVGSVANLLIGSVAQVRVQAIDPTVPSQLLTYQLISGSLPNGLSFDTANIANMDDIDPVYVGVISGTPVYSSPTDTYWTTRSYNFVIRVSNSTGTAVDRNFQLIVSNTVNRDFYWQTPAGNLGTVPAGEFFQLAFQAVETNGNPVTYSFVSGELPAGLQVTPTGLLEGVPTLQTATLLNESQIYRFTVRAQNSLGHVNDRGFNLTVTNVAGPIIEPTTQNLGSYFDGSYFSQQLYVTELGSNVAVTWSNIGSLPPGLTLDSTGLISGYIQPIQLVGNYGPAGYDGDLTVGPVITQQQEYDFPPYDFYALSQSLNYTFTVQAYDGANYDLQPYTIGIISRAGFTADNGNVTADNGTITVDSSNVYVPVILNANTRVLPVGRGASYYAYKFEGYDFQGDTVTYQIADVIGTFDCESIGIDDGFDYGGTGTYPSDNEGTAGAGGVYLGSDGFSTIGTGRSGVGFDEAAYLASTGGGGRATSNLPGLTLDAYTGWLYGKLTPPSTAYQTYSFAVVVSKTHGNIISNSAPTFFTLPVLVDIKIVVTWITPSNLGAISNGTVSQLVLQASSAENKTLVYRMVDVANTPAGLPQGLTLLSSGEISGRVSFEASSVDDYTTTFDNNTLTMDRVYKFTVNVSTSDGSASAVQEFTLTLNVIDRQPYDNLYLEELPAWDQRQIFNSVIKNTEIFVPELIYRADDPWFGVTDKIKMLFLPGLTADSLDVYVEAIAKNHWTKTYNFGNIKTAVVLDSNFKTKYEVVYIEVLDPELNSTNQGPGIELNLTNQIANPYVDAAGVDHKIVYPNNTNNMIQRLIDGVGYYDQSTLPEWMTSNQLDPTNPNGFTNSLGFTKAVVLAYTVPGASNLMAYRLRNSGINFNNIDFTIDRYLIDDYYTQNFNTTTKTYISGKETTFDASPVTGTIAAVVNYAVTVAFSEINGKPVSYVQGAGGIDGVRNFQTGDTLIFAKQENFNNAGPYDGWVDFTDAYIGDNILTPSIEGYSTESYDTYTFIPGYLEKLENVAPINKRGGVWQINIVAGVVNLIFVQEIQSNQRVHVVGGNNYIGAILYYNSVLSAGQTVPSYALVRTQPNTANTRTTFNGDTTRFFTGRDSYYKPGTQDKYVKFPQFGVFN